MWRCVGALEDLEDLDARQRGLQAAALEFVGVGHGGIACGLGPATPTARIGRSYRGWRSPPAARPAAPLMPCSISRSRRVAAAASPCSPPLRAGRLRVAAVVATASSGVITPYRIEIVQGNVVTKEQAARVKPGMTRAQVRDILGSPLLDRRLPRRPLGLRLHASAARAPSRSSAASWCVFDGDVAQVASKRRELPTEREFVASIDTRQAPRASRRCWR